MWAFIRIKIMSQKIKMLFAGLVVKDVNGDPNFHTDVNVRFLARNGLKTPSKTIISFLILKV